MKEHRGASRKRERNVFSSITLPQTWFRKLRRNESGASAMTLGITLPVLIGFTGLGVEVSSWYLEKRELQEAVDSAAVAGAYEFRNDTNVTQAALDTAAAAAMTNSGFGSTTPQVNHPPLTGLYAPGAAHAHAGAVEVVATESYSTAFVTLFGLNNVDITARAVAVQSMNSANACVLALERCLPTDAGVEFQGNLDLDLVDCAVHSNDACYDGVNFNGNPDVQADCVSAGGTVSGSSTGTNLLCGEPKPISPYVDDPYAAVVTPNVSADTCEDPNGTTIAGVVHFTAGRYCGDMNFGADNQLEGGIYFVEGDFRENGATLTGDNVILVYTNSDSSFDFRGNADLDISAPTAQTIKDNNGASSTDSNMDGIPDNAFRWLTDAEADDWAGLLIYNMSTNGVGDLSNCDNKINGTSDISATGTFYFPNTCLVFTGNNKTASNATCLQIIGGNIALDGNAGLDSSGCDPSFNIASFPHAIGLVE